MRAPQRHYAIPRPYTKVGQYLQEMRHAAGLTQRQVSDALEYSSAQFISNFERGIAVPPLKKLRKLQRLYRLDVKELIAVTLEVERERMQSILIGQGKPRHQS